MNSQKWLAPGAGYIVSLPHSGSTILGYLLSEHPAVVFLGEVDFALMKLRSGRRDFWCSCGCPVSRCVFWGDIGEAIGPKSNPDEMQPLLLEAVERVFGKETLIIDSNKTLEPARKLAPNLAQGLDLILTMRDFRGAVVSDAIRKKRTYPNRSGYIIATQSAFQWIRRNHLLEASLKSVPCRKIHRTSYERICKNTAREIESIWSALNLNSRDYKGDPSLQRSHLLAGNKLASSSGARLPLYDERWRKTRIWWPSVILFPILPLLNRRWVYS